MADHPIPWELVPFERLGPIRLDASREEVLALVGEPKFRHTEQAEDGDWLPELDDYPTFSVEYDQTGHVLAASCNCFQPVTYQGWMLTKRNVAEVRKWAESHRLTVNWSVLHRTLWLPELCISFTVPAGPVQRAAGADRT